MTLADVRWAERDSGIKFGSAFFGWLSAMGMTVTLMSILASAGAAVGVATTDPQSASSSASQGPSTLGCVERWHSP